MNIIKHCDCSLTVNGILNDILKKDTTSDLHYGLITIKTIEWHCVCVGAHVLKWNDYIWCIEYWVIMNPTREKTGAQNIEKEIKQYQEKWLQHVQRMDINRLPKQE